jgi:hypothetical protein
VCKEKECPINGGWSDWGACDQPCGDGTKTRACNNPSPAHGGTDCTADGTKATEACKEKECPVHGSWSDWDACDKSCGEGTKSRTCTSPSPAHGGNDCTVDGTKPTAVCKEKECPINGGWSDWGACDQPCGDGTKTRACNNPSPAHGGTDCTADGTKATEACKEKECPVHGSWSDWDACDKSCGEGTKSRTCTSPSPAHGGNDCTVDGTKPTAVCKEKECPINGGWSDWGACDQPCGDGTKTRACNNPSPAHGGTDCTADGTKATEACKEKE